MNPKDVIDTPYVIEDRKQVRRRLVDVKARQGRVTAGVIETVNCMPTTRRVRSVDITNVTYTTPRPRAALRPRSRCCDDNRIKIRTTSGKVGGPEWDTQVREPRGIRTVRRCRYQGWDSEAVGDREVTKAK